VRIPDGSEHPPREVVEDAAVLAAWHSKARGAKGKVEVHVGRARDVRKRRGMAPGKVTLTRWDVVKTYARKPPEDEDSA